MSSKPSGATSASGHQEDGVAADQKPEDMNVCIVEEVARMPAAIDEFEEMKEMDRKCVSNAFTDHSAKQEQQQFRCLPR